MSIKDVFMVASVSLSFLSIVFAFISLYYAHRAKKRSHMEIRSP